MSKEPKKNRSPFSLPINPEAAAGGGRNKRTSDAPVFSQGGSWRHLVEANPAAERYGRENGSASDLEGLMDDPTHRIFDDPTANTDIRLMRKALMASLGREGDRINHTVQFENILLSTLSKIGTVLRRYEGVIDTQVVEELKAIVAQAEQSASEV
jgi:hypothetical protein